MQTAVQAASSSAKSMTDDELIFNLEEEQVTDLTNGQTHATQAVSSNVRNQNFAKETGSLKLKNRSPSSRPMFRSLRLEKHVLTLFYLLTRYTSLLYFCDIWEPDKFIIYCCVL